MATEFEEETGTKCAGGRPAAHGFVTVIEGAKV